MINNYILESIRKMNSTVCAYHPPEIITHFCKAEQCLLPMCFKCLPIHQKEHDNSSSPFQIIQIHQAIDEVGLSINSQFKNLDIFVREVRGNFTKNDEDHEKILQAITRHRQELFDCVSETFNQIYQEHDNNRRRRQVWYHQFLVSAQEIKEELASLIQSLNKEKFLRTVIMWNRLQPQATMEEMIRKSKREWCAPSFDFPHQEELKIEMRRKMLEKNMNLLEIEGDIGCLKFLRQLRILRFGEEAANSLSTSQVSTMVAVSPRNKKPSLGKDDFVVCLSQNQSPKHSIMRKASNKKIAVLSALEKQKK